MKQLKRIKYLALVIFSLIGIFFQSTYGQKKELNKTSVIKKFNNIQPPITLNNGQFNSPVKFAAVDKNVSFFFASEGAVLLLNRETEELKTRKVQEGVNHLYNNNYSKLIEKEYYAVKLNILDANTDVEVIGEERLSWNNNYFIGNDPSRWFKNVPNYSKVRLKNIYENIDLVYYFQDGSLKYDFIIYSGADPEQILLRFDTGDKNSLKIENNGGLLIKTPFGNLIEKCPVSYQISGGKREMIKTDFEIVNSEENTVTFNIGDYNPEFPVTIDPEIIYSTFIGGSGDIEWSYGIAVDAGGNAFITGQTESFDFPVTSGVIKETSIGSINGFVSKINASGTALEFSTYIGSASHSEGLKDIAIDAAGNSYVAGWTHSMDYPTTEGAFDREMNGSDGAVITKLNSNGSELLFSTYLDGFDKETVWAIEVDESNNVYVAGITTSYDFPVTSGAFDESTDSSQDIFISKLNSSGSSLRFSTFLGGSGIDECYDICLDESNNVYISGNTDSPEFPITAGAFCKSLSGYMDGFVSKLSSNGKNLIFSSFLGGSKKENVFGIDIDNEQNVYVTGITLSDDFPITPAAYDTSFSKYSEDQPDPSDLPSKSNKTLDENKYDIFVSKLNSTGSILVYSTYLGGNGNDYGTYLAVDEEGNAYITGYTESNNYPTTSGAFDRGYNGLYDVFVSKLSPDGTRLIYSSYYGGSGDDIGYKTVVTSAGRVYITGWTNSGNFPVSENTVDESFNGGEADVFVLVLDTGFMTDITDENNLIPAKFDLFQNYPNPFNPETAIRVGLQRGSEITLTVYNLLGQTVKTITKNEYKNPGFYTYKWNGRNDFGQRCASGLYIYRLSTANFTTSRKMILLR